MADLVVQLDSEQLERKLDELTGSLKDFGRPFSVAGDKLVTAFSTDVVYAQGRLSGGKWKNWSPITMAARTKRTGYYKAPPERTDMILVWTGRLRRGFEKAVTSTTLIIRNTVEYFKDHQLGEGVPKRPILTINEAVVDIVMDEVNAHVARLLK